MPKIKRLTAGIAVAGTVAGGTLLATEAPAAAYPTQCSAWIISTGQPGGGVAAQCLSGSGQWKVTGLCKNIFTQSSRWIDGSWTGSGLSTAYCAWSEVPINVYYSTR